MSLILVILIFMSNLNFMLNLDEREKKSFITLGRAGDCFPTVGQSSRLFNEDFIRY